MGIAKVTVCLPGLDWPEEFLQQYNLIETDRLSGLNQFFNYGKKNFQALKLSDLIAKYLLNRSLKQFATQQIDLETDKYSILLSPVSQKMHLHHIGFIFDNRILDISNTEAHVLCEDLNHLYQNDQLQFHVVVPDLWLLQLPQVLDFENQSVFDLTTLGDSELKPSGAGADYIMRLQAEIQMFLHNHIINQQREHQSRLPINGLWLWNDLIANSKLSSQQLLITSENFKWLYPDCFVELSELTANLPKWLARGEQQDITIYVDDLLVSNFLLDWDGFNQKLDLIDNNLLQPLIELLHLNKIAAVNLVSSGAQGGEIALSNKSRLAFWRKATSYRGIWIK